MKRRDLLKAAPGLVMVGTGVWALLVPTTAEAASYRFELVFLKNAGKGLQELDVLAIPDAVAAEIEAGNAHKLEFVWHLTTGGKKKKLAQHAAPGRAKLAAKKRHSG